MPRHLFPFGIAEGKAFCNRTKERKELTSNIENGNHTVLSAPRRYGKSSLVRKTIADMKIPHVWIDFLTVSKKEEVQAQIAKLVSEAIYAISPDVKKIQTQIAKVFKGLNSQINIGLNVGKALSTSLSFQPGFEQNLKIDEILLKLDELAYSLKRKIVFVFDEFQQISLLKENSVIEGMIRHAVERSKAITYIFSGSNRHLLLTMFGSKDRPLYRLCVTMSLERIAEKEYLSFLNHLSKEKWGAPLEENTFLSIMKSSERHSFYVNAICNHLWKNCNTLPNEQDVKKAWASFVLSNKNSIISEILDLSINQKRVLNCLAVMPVSEIRGKDFLLMTKLPPSSIAQAVESLESKDILFKDDQGIYQLLDPAVKYYILNSLS